MYLITTRGDITKRLVIPDDVADAEAYALTVTGDAWDNAETVGANWPHEDAAPAPAPAPALAPVPVAVDDPAPLFTDED